MARRPIEQKKQRRLVKSFRRELPRYFDLVRWLIENGHAPTRRRARALILAKRVQADSHPLGVTTVDVPVPGLRGEVKIEKQDVVVPHVAFDLRDRIVVSAHEDEQQDAAPRIEPPFGRRSGEVVAA